MFDVSVITYFVDLLPYGSEGKSAFRCTIFCEIVWR